MKTIELKLQTGANYMIKAYQADYIKFDKENSKRKGHYCIIEMTIQTLSHIHLIIISQDGLVIATSLDSITEITGFHRYITKSKEKLGAGELKALNTKNKSGMLEGLSEQLGFDYSILATAFGEGLLKVGE